MKYFFMPSVLISRAIGNGYRIPLIAKRILKCSRKSTLLSKNKPHMTKKVNSLFSGWYFNSSWSVRLPLLRYKRIPIALQRNNKTAAHIHFSFFPIVMMFPASLYL